MLALGTALAGCTGKAEDTGPVDTGPAPEPDPYTVSAGLPASTGAWDGQFNYSRVHPYSYGEKGPHLEVERLTASASFFAPASWGAFDVMQDEGCWADAWAPGWTEFVEIGESLPVQVGAETVEFLPTTGSDGVLYAWTAEIPAQDWAILPGTTLGVDGVDTTVIVPEPLVIDQLANMWVAYFEAGTLTMEWEPPTIGDTWIHVLRRNAEGGYTRCHVRDDGAVTIQFGSVPDEGDNRVSISRVSSAEVELPTFGRISAYAEDLVRLDP
ncbi:MAG: hypothetical protein Q8P18_31055 [Pseudomonadota bacterium]|nr:hypothetical protein [Pseudomonadota bacterium]